jgi:hypothetical protein
MPRKLKSKSPRQAVVPAGLIDRRIYQIRDRRVMLDSDLADLYRVPTKAFNQAFNATSTASPKISCFS